MQKLNGNIAVHNGHTITELPSEVGVVIHLQTPHEEPRKARSMGVMRFTYEFDLDIANEDFHGTLCHIMGLALRKQILIMGNPALVQRVAIGYLVFCNNLFVEDAVAMYKRIATGSNLKEESAWQNNWLQWLEEVPASEEFQLDSSEPLDDFEDDFGDLEVVTNTVDDFDFKQAFLGQKWC